ncbi:MAG: 16S rRNA (cytidine(1402)-2'-O)-methyltransferase [Chloroflexi bacterium]|nr:16S rRNA (cytidine(1402)-2'-O)-methyltransferase [Chloroflexota bacterium]MDA1297518.1 16S rRNA (cytidine(1402)-2'-O)-methyltransferase [Chloroflexota bacterium]
MSTLFVVATPIGNLQDLSPRAAETLRTVPLIAAEDTRVSRKLLNHAGSSARMLSYNENSPPGRLRQLLEHLESADLALMTDAGTPAVSDPGAILVREAAEAGHKITPIAGPSAVTAALSASGFGGDRFAFLGFPPRKQAERRQFLAESMALPMTLVVLEAPHRFRKTLEDIAAIAPDRELAVCRELTKLHEEVFRGTADSALRHFAQPRGEFVVVLSAGPVTAVTITDELIVTTAESVLKAGLRGRAAVQQVIAETGAPRSRVYPIVLAAQRPD